MAFNVVIDETVGRAVLLNKRRALNAVLVSRVSLQRAAGYNVIRDWWLALSLNTKPEAFAQPQQILVLRSETISTWEGEK